MSHGGNPHPIQFNITITKHTIFAVVHFHLVVVKVYHCENSTFCDSDFKLYSYCVFLTPLTPLT